MLHNVPGETLSSLVKENRALKEQLGVLTCVLRDAENFHNIVRSECGDGEGERWRAYDCLRDSMRAANAILEKRKT
jgi:hypothetical protein